MLSNERESLVDWKGLGKNREKSNIFIYIK